MSRSKESLETVLDRVRDLHVTNFVNALALVEGDGTAVLPEVVRRDEQGNVLRDGVLNLPSRHDFSCKSEIGHTNRDLPSLELLDFEPVDLNLNDSVRLHINPILWDKLQISFDTGDDPKRLLRLRLWFLEWFLPRKYEYEATISGVVHSLTGPKRDGETWHICVDMGTAPALAFTELLSALASRGVSRMTLGAELDQMSSTVQKLS